jgi:sRNA-binding regulator protein Hfq
MSKVSQLDFLLNQIETGLIEFNNKPLKDQVELYTTTKNNINSATSIVDSLEDTIDDDFDTSTEFELEPNTINNMSKKQLHTKINLWLGMAYDSNVQLCDLYAILAEVVRLKKALNYADAIAPMITEVEKIDN